MNSRERKRSDATASARRNSRYSNDTTNKQPPFTRIRGADSRARDSAPSRCSRPDGFTHPTRIARSSSSAGTAEVRTDTDRRRDPPPRPAWRPHPRVPPSRRLRRDTNIDALHVYRLAARRDKRNTLIQPRLGSGNWWRSAIQSARSRLSRWKLPCRASVPPSRPNRRPPPLPPRSRSSRRGCRRPERSTRLH
jgi:hypothetical protein